jgi:hypothetical protein
VAHGAGGRYITLVSVLHRSEWVTSLPAKALTIPREQEDYFILTYLIFPWSKVFLEKLIGSQLVEKFLAF